MIHLALAQLRRRTGRYIALFFSIFAAVGLTVGSVAIVQSLQATVSHIFDAPYKNVQYVAQVRSDNPSEIAPLLQDPNIAFDEKIYIPVQKDDALFRMTFVQSVEESPLQWQILLEGHLPTGDAEVAVTDDTPLGTQVTLDVPTQESDIVATVVGRIEHSQLDKLTGGNPIYASTAAVREWAGKNATGELRISSDLPLESIRSMMPAGSVGEVVSASEHTQSLVREYIVSRNQYFVLLAAFIVVVAIVAAIVIFSSYSVLAADRQREYALLKAVGASAAQLRTSTVIEAIVLSSIAGSLAIPFGTWLAGWAGENAEKFGIQVPLESTSISPVAMALIFVLGIAICVFASLPAANSAIKRPLVESLASSASPTSLLRTGLITLLGGALILSGRYLMLHVDALGGDWLIVFAIGSWGLVILGSILLLAVVWPWLVSKAAGLFAALPKLHLAFAFISKQRLRAGALIAVVFAGSALVFSVNAGQDKLSDYMVGRALNSGAVDVTLQSLDGSVPPGLIESISGIQGVAATVAPETATLKFPNEKSASVYALDAQSGKAVLRGPITGATPGTVVLGTYSPLRTAYSDGSQVDVSVNGTTSTVTVVHSSGIESFIDPALFSNRVDSQGSPLNVSPAVFIRLQGSALQSPDSPVLSAIKDIAVASPDRIAYADALTARASIAQMIERILTMSNILSAVAIFIAGIGCFNAVALIIRERRRDIQLLSVVGMTRAGNVTVLGIELLTLILISMACGALLGHASGSWIASNLVS